MTSPTTDDKFLSLKSVADIFDVKVTTVRRWCREGLIDSTTLPSGHRRILQSEVTRFANERYGQT